MSERTPLAWKEKQSILYSKAPKAVDVLQRLAKDLIAQGRYEEALDFYRVARDQAGFDSLKNLAVEKGDFFLLNALVKEHWVVASPETWEKLAENALKHGYETFHREALRIARPT